MDSTSVEDFQDYHNLQPFEEINEDIHSSPPPLHRNYTSTSHHDLSSDSASLSGSAHHSPTAALFDHPTRTSSPRTSHSSSDSISVLADSHYEPTYKPSAPQRTRPAFRNPSSVHAMQMDTTPPHLASPSSQHRPKLYTPSRQCTPRSARSHRSAVSSPSKLSPGKKMKKEYPLVLLHVTLLPIPLHYSQEVMESVLPPSILENWKTLQEKATDTVLERGILIPHPKEDYDLLEERLLESLELKIPRILKCGHFHLSPEEEADILADSDTEDPDEDATDLDICDDCGRRIRDGKFGSAGSGNKRWDIKLFAANGLMRAGAWSAAWREMERVDVEILPWMEEEMKRELELRKEEEERVTLEDKEREEGVGGLDDERLREIYGGEARAFVDGKIEETDATVEMAARQMDEAKQREGEVPLWDLLREFVNHAVRDRRNVAIFLLSFTVLLLSIGSFGGGRSSVTDIQPERPLGRSRTSVPIAAVQSTAGGFTASTLATMPVVDASPVAAAATSTTTTEQPQSEEGEGEEESILSAWMEAGGDEVSEMVED